MGDEKLPEIDCPHCYWIHRPDALRCRDLADDASRIVQCCLCDRFFEVTRDGEDYGAYEVSAEAHLSLHREAAQLYDGDLAALMVGKVGAG